MLLWLGCLALTPFPPPKVATTQVVELPLVENAEDRRRPYVQIDNAWGTTMWFLDTGYGATTCDDDFVADLGVTTRRSLTWSRGVGGRVRLGKSRLDTFQLGSSTVEGFQCATRDLATTSSVPGDVAGVLGSDILRGYVTEFDWEDGVLRLHPPGTALPEDTFPLRREAFSPRVKAPLQLGEELHWILIDTGASSTWLRRPPKTWEPDATEDVQISGTGGAAVVEVRYFHDPVVGLAGLLVPVDSLRAQEKRRGVLGMDVLGGYESVWLDYAEREGAVSPAR